MNRCGFFSGRSAFGEVWIGVSDTDTEGLWVSAKTKQITTYQPWLKGEPNGKRDENCVVMLINTDAGQWNDDSCDKTKNFVCVKETEEEILKEGNFLFLSTFILNFVCEKETEAEILEQGNFFVLPTFIRKTRVHPVASLEMVTPGAAYRLCHPRGVNF